MTRAAFVALSLLAGCAVPPPEAYQAAPGRVSATAQPIGVNAVGEACTQQRQPTGGLVFCGTWGQPSGRVLRGGAASADRLADLATASPWRTALDRRFACGAPATATVLDRFPAVRLTCARKLGGWPQTATVAVVDGTAWFADGVRAAAAPVDRAIGVLAGVLPADRAAAPDAGQAGLTASRLAAESIGSNDIGRYGELMAAGEQANRVGDFDSAERAYRAAGDLIGRLLGPADPHRADPVTRQALQTANLGRDAEAAALFREAERLATEPAQADLAAVPRLEHYRALADLNHGRVGPALPMLERAEAGYLAMVPPRMLSAVEAPAAAGSGVARLRDRLENQSLIADPTATGALFGVIETRRARARALRLAGRTEESAAVSRSAELLATAEVARQPVVAGRLFRTSAMIADAAGRPQDASSQLSDATAAFARAVPGTRPYAQTALLLAGARLREGRSEEALGQCSAARAALAEARATVSGTLMQPCLSAGFTAALAAEKAGDKPRQQAALADMFAAAQLVQSSLISRQIAEATATLAENARDPRAAALLRDRGKARLSLEALRQEQAEARAANAPDAAELDRKVAAAEQSLNDTEAATQAASPGYGLLVQTAATAAEVFRLLRPGEAFAALVLDGEAAWTFVLRDGGIAAAPVGGGTGAIAGLVGRVRSTMEIGDDDVPSKPYDVAAAQALWAAIFGPVSGRLEGVTALSVAPSGPLLSLPLALLLTGPADATRLKDAPFLVRRMTIAHVPSAANFVRLRALPPSAGTSPWFGFGDIRPVSAAQAMRSFPPATCVDSAGNRAADLLTGLPALPASIAGLDLMRQIAGGGDRLLGASFTAPAVLAAPLKQARILQFASHGLLPTDLPCLREPAIVTSPPAGAADAAGALLTASQVLRLDLDADVVVLAACNSGGPGGPGGENLSGLTRSFFAAGARSMLITHWSVSDTYTAYLTALTLAGTRDHRGPVLAEALAEAQRKILREATGALVGQAHPYYWAGLALVGEGSGGGARTLAAR